MAFHLFVNGDLEEDVLKKKQRELATCKAQYDSSVSLITDTADRLAALGTEIEEKIREIDTYQAELQETRKGLSEMKERNEKVSANFRALLEI